MLSTLGDACLQVGDWLLGWLLLLPTDLALILVALGTSAILVLVRLVATDQNLLARCRQDKTRLRELIRAAKRASDKGAVQRYQATFSTISLKALKSEWKPLLVSLIPMAFVTVWCLARLEFHPPKEGDLVELRSYFPASSIGQVAHVVPQPGIDAVDGWIRKIDEDPAPGPDGSANGLAIWKLRAAAQKTPYDLIIRHAGESRNRRLLVGARHYAPAIELYDDGGRQLGSEVVMRPIQLFGMIPGIPALAFPPWLVAYLLIAIPFVWVFKRACGIF